MNRYELYEQGLKECKEFLALNNIKEPKYKTFERAKVSYCGYYLDGNII